jgi:hypothetical protein
MKLGVLSFVAALLAAPLAAQAVETPSRYGVTFRATISDTFTYESFQSDGECVITQSGSSRGELTLRSVRVARVQVSSGAGGVVYRPSRLAVRLTGSAGRGSSDELRRCRAGPIERVHRDCGGGELRPRVLRVRFRRPSRGKLAFGATPRLSEPVLLCGLGLRSIRRAWLDLAQGSVDEDSLLNGRARRVIARGSAIREMRVLEEASLTVKQRAVLSWTLMFRRLG